MVNNAWFKTDKNLRELDLYKNRILPLAKSALDVSTREYETGSIPFSQAIGSYTDWLKVKLAIATVNTNENPNGMGINQFIAMPDGKATPSKTAS